jgi:hypothetical protein
MRETSLAYLRRPFGHLKERARRERDSEKHRKREIKLSQVEIPKSFFNVRKRREIGWGWGKRVSFLSSSIIIC